MVGLLSTRDPNGESFCIMGLALDAPSCEEEALFVCVVAAGSIGSNSNEDAISCLAPGDGCIIIATPVEQQTITKQGAPSVSTRFIP
jgi:hypothetical protein